MASLHQQQQGSDNAFPTTWGGAVGSSNRIAAVDVDVEDKPPSFHHVDHHQHQEHDHQDYQKPGWRKFLSFVGPSILVSVAYLDPGNIETDLQSGSNHRYELLWVLLVGLSFACIIQSLAANLGVCTGKHLAELCKEEYPKFVRYCLWLLAEVAVVAADIPEVIGTAFGLNLLFHIPLWVGVLCTGFSTILLLGIQKYGMRKLEFLMGVMVLLLAACFFGEMGYVKPPASDLLKGMFVPKFSGQGALSDTIALIGTNIVPHNLFLHSALVLSRKVPNTVRGINKACRYFLIETGFAMFTAFLINVAMVAVPATVCSEENLTSQNADRCNDLTLDSASFLLQNVLGRLSSKLYAIALLAAGQSSAIAATYAGQFIMQGFLGLKMRKWKRNLLTRSIAITPSLIASIIGGPAAAGRLIIIASMVLSFEIPFAVTPLLKFSGSSTKLGPLKNSIYIIVVSWILGLGIVGINVYYLSTGFVGWLIHNNLPKVGNVFIGLIVFPLMAIYILAVIYLTFRKDTVVSFIDPTKNDPTIVPANSENGQENSNEAMQMDQIPYREDLVDIPLPH